MRKCHMNNRKKGSYLLGMNRREMSQYDESKVRRRNRRSLQVLRRGQIHGSNATNLGVTQNDDETFSKNRHHCREQKVFSLAVSLRDLVK